MLDIAADWGKPPYEILKDPEAVRWVLRWQAKVGAENSVARLKRQEAEGKANKAR